MIEKLQEIFRDIFDDEALIITRETSPENIEEWDSLAQISIVSAIEEEFGIEFEISEVAEMTDAGSIIDLIEKKN